MAARTLFGARTPSDEGNGAKQTRPRTELTQENRPQAFANPKANSQICQGEPLKCQVCKTVGGVIFTFLPNNTNAKLEWQTVGDALT